jgi:hypothetical protein
LHLYLSLKKKFKELESPQHTAVKVILAVQSSSSPFLVYRKKNKMESSKYKRGTFLDLVGGCVCDSGTGGRRGYTQEEEEGS